MTGSWHSSLWSRIKRILGNGKHGSDGASQMMDRDVFSRAMRRERSRADRAGAPFSLVIVSGLLNGGNGNGALRRGKVTENLGEILTGIVRCTDIVGWYDEDKVGLILPHTSGSEAWNLVERAEAELERRLRAAAAGNGVSFCVHAYPFDEPLRSNGYRQLSLFERRGRS